MRQILRWTDAALLVLANLCLAGFLTTIVLQVFFRYVLKQSLAWSEEVGVILFVWSAFLAATVVVGMNDHFSITLFVERLSDRPRRILDVIGAVLGILFALIMVWNGAVWSWRMFPMFTPTLQLPQGAVYAVIPLSGGYIILHLMVRLATLLFGTQQTRENKPC